MPSSRVRAAQLPAPRPGRQQRLDPRRDAGGVQDAFQRRQRDHGRAAPSRATACSSPPGSRPATRSPSRWEQLIPAARMNAASPSSSPQSASHVARSREVSSRGSPPPPSSDADQRGRDVPAARLGAAADRAAPGERRGGQQPVLVAGQDRHRAGARAPDLHQHAARPAGHVGAADIAQVTADQPGTRPQADEPGRAHPPLRRRLGVRQREEPGDLRRAVRLLGALPGQRQVRRIQLRDDPAADEPQVRAQRPPRRRRQSRRAPGEPLDRRRVQQHLRHRLQARARSP